MTAPETVALTGDRCGLVLAAGAEAVAGRRRGMSFNLANYETVEERIDRFWTEYPNGAIRTELASPASSFTEVVFRAEVYKDRDTDRPDATGYAAEAAGTGGMANKTSWHENCETSAIGRALANMNYATKKAPRPSRQEMEKVERAQPRPATTVNQTVEGGRIATGVGMTDQQRKMIWAVATKERGMTDADVEAMSMELFGVELKALDKAQASEMIGRLKDEAGGGVALPHPKVQEAIDNREASWIAAIEGAATLGELGKVARQIQQGGTSSEALREAYRKRQDALKGTAAAA